MRIEDRLDSYTKRMLNKLRGKQSEKKEVRKYHESLSDRDLENLMGVCRPRHVRDRGVFRQR